MLRSLGANWRMRPAYLLWLLVPILVWWVLRSVPLARIWAALSGIGWPQIVALLLLNGLAVVLLSGRWWVILRGQGLRIPYLVLASYRLAAFGISYFTPGPQFGGEPLQVHLVKKKHSVPAATATASVALDKVLELIVNFSVLVGGVTLTVHQQAFGGQVGSEAVALAVVLLALPIGFLVTLWVGLHPLAWLVQRTPAWLRARHAFRQICDIAISSEAEIASLCRQQPYRVVQALVVSLLSWVILLVELWLAVSFLGINLRPPQLVVVLTAARIAFLLPLPGGLGTLEASQVLAFQALGFDPAVGLSLSLVIRARDVLFGAAGLWWGTALIGNWHNTR